MYWVGSRKYSPVLAITNMKYHAMYGLANVGIDHPRATCLSVCVCVCFNGCIGVYSNYTDNSLCALWKLLVCESCIVNVFILIVCKDVQIHMWHTERPKTDCHLMRIHLLSFKYGRPFPPLNTHTHTLLTFLLHLEM